MDILQLAAWEKAGLTSSREGTGKSYTVQMITHSSRPMPTVTFTSSCSPCSQVAQVYLGSDANLMDSVLAERLGLGLMPLEESLSATALDGRLLR